MVTDMREINELKKKILESDFYKSLYENQYSRSVDLYVNSVEEGIEEASAILQCPIYELTYQILEEGSKGIFKIGTKPYYVRYTHIIYEKSSIPKGESLDYTDQNTSYTNKKHTVMDKDSEIILRVKRDGVFLKVNPPIGQGKKITNMLEVEQQLIDAGISQFDSPLAKNILAEQKGEYQKIAEWDDTKSHNNGKVTYSVSEDKMRAFITVTKPLKGGREMDINDIKEVLENNGIIFGLQEESLNKALESKLYNASILAAEGVLPIPGKNAKIEYIVNVDKKSVPKYIGEDQSIDYKDISIVENVQKGQKLAHKIEATLGEAGRNVYGERIETGNGKDIDLKEHLGDNVEISEDGNEIIASINGQVILKAKLLSVEPVFEVPGDVGPETGNINFLGSVLVKGNVKDNYSIKADGNIDVQGTVGKSTLEAKGNIMVKLGIQGHETGMVKAEGDVIAKFIQFANVEAGRDVVVTESILNSNVDADNRIILIGKRASASGGKLRALHEVNGKILGSPSASKTIIETGVKPAKRRALDDLDKEKIQLESGLEELQRNIKSLEQAEKMKKLDDEKKEQLQGFKDQFDQANNRISEILVDRERIMQEIQEEKIESIVSAGKEALNGVVLTIGTAEFILRQNYKSITFFEENGIIQTEKYRGEAKPIKDSKAMKTKTAIRTEYKKK